MTRKYGAWPALQWTNNEFDWKKANTITAGIDIGTTSTQAAIFADDILIGYASIRTGYDFNADAWEALRKAIGNLQMEVGDINSIGATGFGRKNVDFATKTLDEIHCHAKGARYMFGPSVTTVVDLGGQTCKAIRLYDWDRVRDFKTNDKCATGMGRQIEVVCELMHVPITEIGEKSRSVENDPEPVSTTCYNFAYPETIGLLRQGYKEDKYSEGEVLASYLFAISWRIVGQVGKLQPLDVGDVGVHKELAFTGGLANNRGITDRLERDLNATALKSELNPQLAGAIGAALLV